MGKTVYVVIGCDTDPDRPSLLDNVPTDALSWRGMLEGIPRLKRELGTLVEREGVKPVFTWCLRADAQVKHYYGSYGWVLQNHLDFLRGLEQDGDELAWHPHFWRFDESTATWYQECFDRDWQTTMLRDAHADYIRILPNRAKSVRMGWDYHNNATFEALESLGVVVDFSGIPGLGFKPAGPDVRGVNFFDWTLSPNRPYYPARPDYRREPKGGEQTFTLLESPNFASRSVFWSMLAGVQYMLKMKDLRPLARALVNPTYWIGVTGKTRLFMPLVDQALRELRQNRDVVFVTYFHPDELLENKHRLYSLENMIANLRTLVTAARKHDSDIRFIRAIDIPDVLK